MQRLFMIICAISVLLTASCAAPTPEPQAEPAPDTLAQQVYDILKNRCYQCHGQPDHPTFGEVVPLDWILDYDKLIEHRLVIPGSVKKSRLVYLMVMGEMPREMDENGSPSGRVEMPEAEIELIAEWIKQDAPAWE
ncbi:MAG: heme-binding domain-containing protein [Planctomycetes bacterium]|nr:heme-binding domain-containing protein [Planctomycetota bacterium]